MDPIKQELWAEKKAIISQFMEDPRTTGGRDRLYGNLREQHPNISRRDVARALAEDPTHQIHRPLNKRITSRPIIVNGPARAGQTDLIDVQKLAGKNDGTRFLMTYVDLFSKYAAVEPLKNKTIVAVTAGMKKLLDKMPLAWRPKLMQSDNGGEFSRTFEEALHARNIKTIHSAAYAPQTQGAIERFNRTLKSAMFELMTRKQNARYIDYIGALVENFNNTKHGTTGFKPMEIMTSMPLSPDLIALIHDRMRNKIKRSTQHEIKFGLGQKVRVAVTTESSVRKVERFRKKITANWSRDVFEIYAVSEPETAATQPQYLLKNLTTNRKSKKRYFGYQLQPVSGEFISEDSVASDEEDEEQGPEEPEQELYLPQPQPQQPPRRSARAWQPSQEGLRSFAAR